MFGQVGSRLRSIYGPQKVKAEPAFATFNVRFMLFMYVSSTLHLPVLVDKQLSILFIEHSELDYGL